MSLSDITTEEVGNKLEEEYSGNDDTHIDYFYLQIRIPHKLSDKDRETIEKLAEDFMQNRYAHPPEWKRLYPHNVWPLEYYGKYNKKSKECERDRERRLNIEVREPLKSMLEEELKKSKDYRTPDKCTVNIKITRACKYTCPEEPMDTSR